MISKELILTAFAPMHRFGVERFVLHLSFADGRDLAFTSGGAFCATLAAVGQRALEEDLQHAGVRLERFHPECRFTFSAFSTSSAREFETLCIELMNNLVPLIVEAFEEYRYLFVMADKQLRDAVIRGGYEKEIVVTGRARDCLWHAGHGKSAKETAKLLSISPSTVENHLKNIREKFDKKPCSVIFIECLHRGIFGGVGIRVKKEIADTRNAGSIFIQ